MHEIEGHASARGLRIGIVVSRFNETVTEGLLRGACQALRQMELDDESLTVLRVPGSFEIPQAAQMLAEKGGYDALVCLGALIKGETDHYEYLAREVTQSISRISFEYRIPIGFGLLTTRNAEQALNRAGRKQGNKGAEAARAAVKMAQLKRNLGDR